MQSGAFAHHPAGTGFPPVGAGWPDRPESGQSNRSRGLLAKRWYELRG